MDGWMVGHEFDGGIELREEPKSKRRRWRLQEDLAESESKGSVKVSQGQAHGYPMYVLCGEDCQCLVF